MTPAEELAQKHLADTRHLELMTLLKEIRGLMTVAAGTVIKDPEALRLSVDNVIKDAE